MEQLGQFTSLPVWVVLPLLAEFATGVSPRDLPRTILPLEHFPGVYFTELELLRDYGVLVTYKWVRCFISQRVMLYFYIVQYTFLHPLLVVPRGVGTGKTRSMGEGARYTPDISCRELHTFWTYIIYCLTYGCVYGVC